MIAFIETDDKLDTPSACKKVQNDYLKCLKDNRSKNIPITSNFSMHNYRKTPLIVSFSPHDKKWCQSIS